MTIGWDEDRNRTGRAVRSMKELAKKRAKVLAAEKRAYQDRYIFTKKEIRELQEVMDAAVTGDEIEKTEHFNDEDFEI